MKRGGDDRELDSRRQGRRNGRGGHRDARGACQGDSEGDDGEKDFFHGRIPFCFRTDVLLLLAVEVDDFRGRICFHLPRQGSLSLKGDKRAQNYDVAGQVARSTLSFVQSGLNAIRISAA